MWGVVVVVCVGGVSILVWGLQKRKLLLLVGVTQKVRKKGDSNNIIVGKMYNLPFYCYGNSILDR